MKLYSGSPCHYRLIGGNMSDLTLGLIPQVAISEPSEHNTIQHLAWSYSVQLNSCV